MKIPLKYIIWPCLILLTTACSSNKYRPSPNARVYSISTENEFELIEKNDFSHKTYTRSNPKPMTLKESPRVTPVEVQLETQKETPAQNLSNPTIQASSKLSAKNQERLQEINQNLAFYCMKHRNDPAYKNEEKCLKFTEKVLNSCQKEHRIVNAVMLSCIKGRLKNRR